jgi:hypothetical protein
VKNIRASSNSPSASLRTRIPQYGISIRHMIRTLAVNSESGARYLTGRSGNRAVAEPADDDFYNNGKGHQRHEESERPVPRRAGSTAILVALADPHDNAEHHEFREHRGFQQDHRSQVIQRQAVKTINSLSSCMPRCRGVNFVEVSVAICNSLRRVLLQLDNDCCRYADSHIGGPYGEVVSQKRSAQRARFTTEAPSLGVTLHPDARAGSLAMQIRQCQLFVCDGLTIPTRLPPAACRVGIVAALGQATEDQMLLMTASEIQDVYVFFLMNAAERARSSVIGFKHLPGLVTGLQPRRHTPPPQRSSVSGSHHDDTRRDGRSAVLFSVVKTMLSRRRLDQSSGSGTWIQFGDPGSLFRSQLPRACRGGHSVTIQTRQAGRN